MAAVSAALLRLVIAISLLSISANAGRPCKTLLISSYSFSISSSNPQNPNPNGEDNRFFTIFTVRQINPNPRPFLNPRVSLPYVDRIQRSESLHRRNRFALPFDDLDSFKDRTKDILSVVVALLFGVGCGALTAATMYLFWALFSHRDYDYDYESDGDDVSPKNMGYVKIPEDYSKPAPVKEAA